jgi:GT2 family glycosyltransferase
VEGDPRISVVVATRDRRDELLATLARIVALPEAPPVVVVDNGSRDGTVAAVRAAFPAVRVIALGRNAGAAARTAGTAAAGTPYVAFCDDDSWWAPGALTRAADLLEADERIALVAARVLNGPEERLEPTCALMACSPLTPWPGLPGPRVLGFVACGAVVRRTAFLAVGGFLESFGIGGEEELLACDLAAAGHALVYAGDVVAHHHPSARRDRAARRATVARNALWFAWLRRPAGPARARTAAALRAARHDRDARRGLLAALRGLPWVLPARRPVRGILAGELERLAAPPSPIVMAALVDPGGSTAPAPPASVA